MRSAISLIEPREPLCSGRFGSAMVWKRLFGKREHELQPIAATPEPDAVGSCVAGLPPPIRRCKAGSTRLRQRRDMAAYDLERAERRGSRRIPGGSGWSCSTARWRRSKTICARSTTIAAAPANFTSRDADHRHRRRAGGAGQRRLHDRAGALSLGRGDRLGSARRARRARSGAAAFRRCRGARAAGCPGGAARRAGAAPRRERDGLRARSARPRPRRRAATGVPDAGRSGPPLPGVWRLARLARSLRHLRHAGLAAPEPARRSGAPGAGAGRRGGRPPQMGRATAGRSQAAGRHRRGHRRLEGG